MIQHLAWMLAVLLSCSLGFTVGLNAGEEKGVTSIANDCRQAGHFAVKRTGFECRKVEK